MQRHHSPPESSPGTTPEALAALKDRIEYFLLGLQHPTVTEPGRDVIDLSASSYSLSTEYNKLLWHIWNEGTNLVRQITAIGKEGSGRMELRFQKFGKGPPGTLVLAESRAASEQLARRSQRARYGRTLRRFLAQLFPQWKIEALSSEPDLQRSFSGLYTRGVLVRGRQAWAVIGAGEQEDPQCAEGILTYGLIWLDWLRSRDTRRVFEGLKIFVPPKRVSITLQRLAWMDSQVARWEVYETGEDIRRADLADIGNLKTSLPPAAGPFALRCGSESLLEKKRHQQIKRIMALSPAIEMRFTPDNFRVLAVKGLPFARETATGVIFGTGRAETLLEEGNFGDLKRMVAALLRFRRADSEDRLHPYYRLQPEKWMQSTVRRQISALGYDLVADGLYEQVPSLSGTERGLLDLLAVTSQGRLVVVELKASEDIHLPLQALDYWTRVRWHQQRGDLERQGYFPARMLRPDPPLLLLVSPALQFHPGCEKILRYFSPSVEAVRVGLNENWREELRVVFRMGR